MTVQADRNTEKLQQQQQLLHPPPPQQDGGSQVSPSPAPAGDSDSGSGSSDDDGGNDGQTHADGHPSSTFEGTEPSLTDADSTADARDDDDLHTFVVYVV